MPPAPKVFSPISPDAPLLKWRTWAVQVARREGTHAQVSAGLAGQAVLLVRLLDQLQEHRRSGELRDNLDPLEGSVQALLGGLLPQGVRSPA
jgi:hypothetical protein